MQLKIPSRLGYWKNVLIYKTTMHRLKPMFFFPIDTALCLLLTSYLGVIYLKSWFSWLWGGVQKALKKRRKQAEEKHWKVERKENEEYEESQIIAVYIFGFKLYFARKYDLKNLFKLFMPSNFIYSFYALWDIWSTVIIHQSYIYKIQNCNIIDIYINRLSITTHIFIAMDYLIMMSYKNIFRKGKKHLARPFFPNP